MTAKLVTKKTLMVTAKMLTNVLMVSMHNVMRMPDALILLVAFVVNVMMDMPVMERLVRTLMNVLLGHITVQLIQIALIRRVIMLVIVLMDGQWMR